MSHASVEDSCASGRAMKGVRGCEVDANRGSKIRYADCIARDMGEVATIEILGCSGRLPNALARRSKHCCSPSGVRSGSGRS